MREIEDALASLTAILFWTGKFSVNSIITKCLIFILIAGNVDLKNANSPGYFLYYSKAVVAETALRLQVICSLLLSNMAPIANHRNISRSTLSHYLSGSGLPFL